MAEKWMDTGVGRAQAGTLDEQAAKIKKAKASIDDLVGQLKQVWWGEDQKRFESKWNGQYAADLTKAATGLSKAADEIRTNAKEQDKVSG
jgi:uncharacterized protein YukE